MPKPPRLAALVVSAALAAAAAAAGPLAAQQPLPQPGRGQGGAPPADERQTLLELAESARRQVAQDELVATMAAHAEAADARAAQNTVNRMMAGAIEAARKVAGVRHSSGNYAVDQRQDRESDPPVWAAEQQLTLTSGDGQALLGLVGELQGAGLAVQELRWTLAAATRRNVERQLLGEALEAMQRTARAAADGLGLRLAGWRRVSLVPEGEPPGPVFRSRMAAAQAEMAPPVSAAGSSEVVVTVNAEAVLTPGR